MEKHITMCLSMFVYLIGISGSAWADDVEANQKVQVAAEETAAGNHYAAAELYKDAELLADDTTLKANALKGAAESYRKAGYYAKEFECLESLLRAFPNHVDFKATVERQFKIADLYYEGYRENIGPWLEWIGIKNSDKSREFYEIALSHGLFSAFAPIAKLRLARLMISTGKNEEIEKGIVALRELTADYPGTESQKFGQLELANVLVQKAARGDGDETYGNEARDLLNDFIVKYPNDPEIAWVKDALQRVDENSAKRLLEMANFYQRRNNPAGAAIQYRTVLKYFGSTSSARIAESSLKELEPTLPLPAAAPESIPIPQYVKQSLPRERKDILVIPEHSEGKWLRPIEDYSYDLKRNRAEANQEREQIIHSNQKTTP